MFGTMGFSELIIILVIILIIFGAGRLPQIGEGVGKALKGFKKEVQEPIPVADPNAQPDTAAPVQPAQASAPAISPAGAVPPSQPTAPYKPGPELTPGTTAASMAAAAPQVYQAPPQPARLSINQPLQQPTAQAHQLPTMEDRLAQPAPVMGASYPALPAAAQAKPVAKRASAIVNKDAVARVQAQQAAMRAKAAQPASSGLTPEDMGSFGQGLGEAFRMVKDVTAEVRGAIDPQVRTLRAEVDAATKEIEQSIEAAKEMPAVHEEPPAKPA